MEDESGKQPTAECPEGFDYRQLRAYVRSADEDSPLPPGVWAHIDQCVVCRPKWIFLRRTDPIVREQFKARVLAVADQVAIQEVVFRPMAEPEIIQPELTAPIQKAMVARAGVGGVDWLFEKPAMDRIL